MLLRKLCLAAATWGQCGTAAGFVRKPLPQPKYAKVNLNLFFMVMCDSASSSEIDAEILHFLTEFHLP